MTFIYLEIKLTPKAAIDFKKGISTMGCGFASQKQSFIIKVTISKGKEHILFVFTALHILGLI